MSGFRTGGGVWAVIVRINHGATIGRVNKQRVKESQTRLVKVHWTEGQSHLRSAGASGGVLWIGEDGMVGSVGFEGLRPGEAADLALLMLLLFELAVTDTRQTKRNEKRRERICSKIQNTEVLCFRSTDFLMREITKLTSSVN